MFNPKEIDDDVVSILVTVMLKQANHYGDQYKDLLKTEIK